MHVFSTDGTPIAYRRTGNGLPVILIGGGLDDGSQQVPLAAELGKHYTVSTYADRR